jgi:methionyl-tRNA synthetase
MQGAMWLGVKDNYTMTDVFSVFHLMVNGEKMSKSRGNFYSGDQLTNEMGYDPDQVRYFLSTLGIPEKQSNFDFETFKERNKFLAGPLNAAIEKPISAVHSRFDGKVPEGKLLEKAEKETMKIVQAYLKNMEKAEHITLLGLIENYARLINSFFVQYKPHDDRAELEGRKDALYSSFYVLKNLMIMLYPFVPQTMDRVRESLNLPQNIFSVDELGTGLPVGHIIGEKKQYFPAVEGMEREA